MLELYFLKTVDTNKSNIFLYNTQTNKSNRSWSSTFLFSKKGKVPAGCCPCMAGKGGGCTTDLVRDAGNRSSRHYSLTTNQLKQKTKKKEEEIKKKERLHLFPFTDYPLSLSVLFLKLCSNIYVSCKTF